MGSFFFFPSSLFVFFCLRHANGLRLSAGPNNWITNSPGPRVERGERERERKTTTTTT
jgi:hypothetical protein